MAESPMDESRVFEGLEKLKYRSKNGGEVDQYMGYYQREDGKEMHYRVFLNPNAKKDSPVLMALHGTSSTYATFMNAIEDLFSQTGYAAIVTPDLHGHGRSDKIEGSIEIEDYAKDLEGLLDEISIVTDQYGQTMLEETHKRVISANSGHAAIALEMYQRNQEFKKQNAIEGVILQGPVYHYKDTFLGRVGGKIAVDILTRLPIGNIAKGLSRLYGNKFAKTDADKEIQKTRRVTTDNGSIRADVKSIIRWYENHQDKDNYSLTENGTNIAIIHSPGHDNLSRYSPENMIKMHGGQDVEFIEYVPDEVLTFKNGQGIKSYRPGDIIPINDKILYAWLDPDEGHHLQKQNPKKLAEYHTEALKTWGIFE